ncbi:hypothetical protein [Methanococcus maripaludis]|uniref:Uncharacterized protein n=1 Tax=Methanococcus maripaludis TaxID=39152 RepID=A0A8T4H569_METMI|nr:hypothetical protein [Methanococcus maripaludis]MBM7408737.1 hypothetical protein [Methanococcus maripaludis]MBP2219094.1 hypothetical protein [Methanococcus maripaludis]
MRKTTELTIPSITATAISYKGLCGFEYTKIRRQINSEYWEIGSKLLEQWQSNMSLNMYSVTDELYNAKEFNFKGKQYGINVIGNGKVRKMCMDIASIEMELNRKMDDKYESMLNNIIGSLPKYNFETQERC